MNIERPEAGRQSPAMPVLVQNMVNGDYSSTHQVSVFYPTTEAMDQSFALNASSPDWSKFQGEVRASAQAEWENVYAIQMAKVKKDPTTLDNAVSIVYNMTVTDAAAYVAAFETLLASDEAKAFPGNDRSRSKTMQRAIRLVRHSRCTFVAESTGELIEHVMRIHELVGNGYSVETQSLISER
ncbi:MAG: hypothetical protein ACJ0RQ_10040 [Candidatus Azotimanducaceae bacterium]